MKLTQTERFIHQFRRLAKGNPRVVAQVEKTPRGRTGAEWLGKVDPVSHPHGHHQAR